MAWPIADARGFVSVSRLIALAPGVPASRWGNAP
jgi:hypothetical protein